MDEKNNLTEAENPISEDVLTPVIEQELTNTTDGSQHTSQHSHHGHHHHHSHHGHHHHHHGHHRHHHRHHRRSKKKTFIRFVKKHRSVLINVLCCTLCVIILLSYAFYTETKIDVLDASLENSKSLKIEGIVFNEEVPLVTEAVLSFVSADNTRSAKNIYSIYSGSQNKLNVGLPVKYSYKLADIPDDTNIVKVIFEISESDSFKNIETYSVDFSKDSGNVKIYNLKPGTRYYYRLLFTESDGDIIGTKGEFRTAVAPRVLSIDGALNVRDIGGWNTASGKKIKYGLLYRGSELDGLVEPTYKITDQGLKQMLQDLEINYDMDLRSAADNPTGIDALGDSVTHKSYDTPQYVGIFDQAQQESIRRIFSDLANEKNYPVYVHCTYGMDRTGTVCYLLEGLLGVNDADLRKDYELSTLTYGDIALEQFAVMDYRIKELEGNTTQEKIEGYLLSIGVTAEEIASIRNIFLG